MSDCPFPFQKYPIVTMAHGAGGRFTQQLIDDVFSAALGHVQNEHDAALVQLQGTLAYTTDAFVVKPLFFPGGDIARLAVTGTCNDLAVSGARPRALSCSWIIEEGFATESLFRLARSMAEAAAEVGAQVVTGDTKVVERGHGDGVYLSVSGIGSQVLESHPSRIREGDRVLVSGDLGRHGACIMSVREELKLRSTLESDCAHLWPAVAQLVEDGIQVHCMRDLTRGGLATALIELSQASSLGIRLRESSIPVSESVASICELFGLDPLYVTNEGRMLVIASPDAAPKVLAGLGSESREIGVVTTGDRVVMDNAYGASRQLDMLSGEQLPRIC